MKIAITRGISPRFAECELTHLEREPIDLGRAHAEHAAYLMTLRALGIEVIELPALAEYPDCMFVEDAAVAFAECAVITRPGSLARRGETRALELALAPYRTLRRIEAPGTLDGGDVLTIGRQVFVGDTPRSNTEGAAQLARHLAPWGYSVHRVPVDGCLHLKSAVTEAAPGTLLINPAWVAREPFAGFRQVEVDPQEPAAANVLLIGTTPIYALHYRRTLARLRAAGIEPVLVDAGEVAKAEGAVTCCSVVFDAPAS